jgi:AraC-like DNA-binding protein
VLEAKRKALYSDANMKEVAYSLDFEDIAHFGKFFKNSAEINFTDFRQDTAPPPMLRA